MPRIWVAAVMALAWIVMASNAQADTVYLKDGRSLWGTDTYEEGDTVVLVRPGGEMKIPKDEVNRIERTRSSLIPHYQVPGTGSAPTGEGPGGAAPAPGGSPAAAPRGPAPSPGGPTALPPAPTPPPPPGTPKY
ncbi:MAG: hypothetical protein ACM362_05410 [Candidatus Methylomirabilota bacterium]